MTVTVTAVSHSLRIGTVARIATRPEGLQKVGLLSITIHKKGYHFNFFSIFLYFFLNCALISFFIVFVTACFMYQLSHSALSFALIVINLRNLRQLPKFYDENK